MPFRNPRNHQLAWFDLLVGARNASWWKVVYLIFSKQSTKSNYVRCANRRHDQVRDQVYSDSKVKDHLKNNPGLEKAIKGVLDEMCHFVDESDPVRKLKFSGVPFLKCITKIYSHIYFNNHLLTERCPASLCNPTFKSEYLSITENTPVILLPTHKSYMDFLLISYILFYLESPLPVVATGDNFKAMGKYLTNYLKETGAFLVRRNSHNRKDIDASVYYDILRAYVHSLIVGGEHPLEFFMEGTRTRTGQILRPKTGILSMVVDLYIKNDLDVYILPVSCNYQRPIEEQLYIAETDPQIGMKKPKESATNLLRAFQTIMRKNYGSVYVRFTEPFKLSHHYNSWKDRNSELVESNDKEAILHKFTDSLASKVCLHQAYNTVLMPFNLFSSSAIARCFLNENKQGVEKCNGLKDGDLELADTNVEIKNEVCRIAMKDLMRDFANLENFLSITQPQFMPGWKSYCDIFDEFLISRDDIIRASHDRKDIEFDSKPSTFFTFIYYSNQVMQMVLPTLISLLVKDPVVNNALTLDYKTIRKLLSYEFLSDDSNLDREIQDAINSVNELNNILVQSNDNQRNEVKTAISMLLVHLRFFVESYLSFLTYVENTFALPTSKQSFPQTFDKTHFFEITNNTKDFISKDMLKNMMVMVTDNNVCNFKLDPKAEDQILSCSQKKLVDIRFKFANLQSIINKLIQQYSN